MSASSLKNARETQNILVTLTESTATITGRVTDAESGDPVRGATITTDGEQTTTDADGSFSLGVVVGTHTITLRKEGYDTSTLQVNVGPGETKDVHATLSESRSTITGTVTDAKTGDPISGATIKADGEQAITDSVGSFSLSVKAGTYTLTVTQKGYKTSMNPVTVNPGATKNVPMIISSAGLPILPITAGISGIVVVAIVAFLKTRKPVERVPKPSALRITAEPTNLPADGRSTSNIIVELINEEGDPIKATDNMKVVLTTSTGSITSPLTISKGETTINTTLRSSLETGNVKVLAESKGLKGACINLAFTEKKRYCMHCGAQMSIVDPACPNCRQMPPSGVDVKQCPNCAEIMPSIEVLRQMRRKTANIAIGFQSRTQTDLSHATPRIAQPSSSRPVAEQYQTTSKTNEKTQPNTRSNEKTKRNASALGHRGGSNPQNTTARTKS